MALYLQQVGAPLLYTQDCSTINRATSQNRRGTRSSKHSVSQHQVCDWHSEWQARLGTVVPGRGQVGTAQWGYGFGP